jgi:hypothetical protein
VVVLSSYDAIMKKLKLISFCCFIIVCSFLFMAYFELFGINSPNVIAKETHRPQLSINVTNPDQTILTNFINIHGTTYESGGSGIKEVDIRVSKIPSSDTANYELAIPTVQGNWSRWSFPIVLEEPGSYLVRSRVTDNAGNQRWSDLTIDFPAYIYNKRIAFIEPTFTYAAYQKGSFYDFYAKYSPMIGKLRLNGSKITADLNLLRNRPIPHGPFQYYRDPAGSLSIPYIEYFRILLQNVKKNSPFVTNITDVDVHQGKIFRADGKNAYDVLFLFHSEYATASEYNNLRQFVSNGGTIVFTEANKLFAEVSYNKTNDSITLVKGHYWKFDGKSATPDVSERWLNENKEWIGSNFLDVPSSTIGIYFANNPFNYTHTEEDYVTNSKAKILIDYHAYGMPRHFKKYQNATVAAYEMNYGKGKIINLGIWGHVVTNNKAFLNYFDNVLIPDVLGPAIQYLPRVSLDTHNANYILLPTTGPSGAVVNYLLPSALANMDPQFIPVCTPAPGSTFPIGKTMVKCTATDKAGNNTAIATFTVEVGDMTSH